VTHAAMPAAATPDRTTFGHPNGLFVIFFAELWERFSYYGMRSLLVFYMLKGFLGYGDSQAYAVYGAYTAMVYMTPFFGGWFADNVLGQRRAVVLGGLLMAAGHLMMTVEHSLGFYIALGLLICGNGFFKPNISTIVGSLYPEGPSKRGAGFTIFYMGVNLGAALSPLLCGYIGETYGWHYGFGLATIGMLSGISMFVAPVRVTQILIMAAALAAAVGLIVFRPDNPFSIGLNVLIALSLLTAAVISWVALGRGGLPGTAGQPRHPERMRRRVLPGLTAEHAIYVGTLLAVPVFALLVSGGSPLLTGGAPIQLISSEVIAGMERSTSAVTRVAATVLGEVSRPAGLLLLVAGLGAYLWVFIESLKLGKVRRERMFVVLILTFFSMLFWAFFEQAGSSINNFTDRNVNRAKTREVVTADMVGRTIRIQPTQLQLGYTRDDRPFTMTVLDSMRSANEQAPAFEIDWMVEPGHVGMGIAQRRDETPASTYQAINPAYILLFGLAFTILWGWLASIGKEPGAPIKFALGLLQLALGFGALWWGAQTADGRGMVALAWLFLGYLLHTTGELCLSPVGLAMVTDLSPRRLVSTIMGTWFLATAFAQYLAAIISQFTGVGGENGGGGAVPVPTGTVHLYGDVFGNIAIAGLISAAICFLLVPVLGRWMHRGVTGLPEE
jgi:POT family proton-dependent oligopeptide transporter